MRDYFESLEFQILAPYAAKSRLSRGRRFDEPFSESRTIFQHDRDRIIHSKAFRRLKHKTQVFIATESDHYRSRLTHSLEVAQISRHLARLLRLNEDLAEAVALAHDLGHTPFGHSGERELNRLLADHGGFEHNLQSLRVVDELEQKYPQFPGLNLSYEVRHGLQKHQTPWDHPQYLSEHFVTLEAQVVNLADEIAYNNHDLDDGLSARILEEAEISKQVTLWREAKAKIKDRYVGLDDAQLKYLINSYLISWQITDVIQTTENALKSVQVNSLEELQNIQGMLVSFSPEMKSLNKELRTFLFENFYQDMTIYRMNQKGKWIIKSLFGLFMEDPKLIPDGFREKIENPHPLARVVADYIAGMTDSFALKEYQAFFC